MLRKHKKYRRPKKLYDKVRIEEENKLVSKYGLKNKKEIWKAEAAIGKIRRKAKSLITAEKKEQEIFFKKLNNIGLNIKTIADALALNKEDWLKRRLQSIVVAKKIARAPKQARQLIVHKHILVNNKVVNVPSYIVALDKENKIEIRIKPKKKPKEKKEEVKQEELKEKSKSEETVGILGKGEENVEEK